MTIATEPCIDCGKDHGPQPDGARCWACYGRLPVRTHFIGGIWDGQVRTIERRNGTELVVPLPKPVTFYSPDTLRETTVWLHRYRFIGEIWRSKHAEPELVMAIDTMPDDEARKALDDLVATLNREHAEAHR